MTIQEASQATTQYLSFNLGEELFALDISKVREVIEFLTVTKVPQMPEYMRGVINLRGGVVPVIDLKQRFGMEMTAKTVNTCVIITEVRVDGEPIILGAMADSVDEVFDLYANQIEPAPKIGTHLNTDFLKGMGKKDEEFILILDIDKVFAAHELSMVQKAGEQAREHAGEQADEKAGAEINI
jgi:purine-binding chemotaxis protein CheW